ncbi:hypothetical protein L6164_037377 [Bauhinia variegata]|uniref:Uncharacterized protein n=1 Tax=Bauhinia variegata TaxID=167791 RepID=A0ACB9KJU7_BAUVA|nr:hypothetical protein L6164_037377 [Bauhinia variegata]
MTSPGVPQNIFHFMVVQSIIYHHYVGGQSQSNFASVFTYCDYIYGTDKGYRYQQKTLRKLEEFKDGVEQNGGSYSTTIQDCKSE